MMMDYKLLEALANVIQEGGFDKAADKLCITQSAVSQRIKLLEEETGRILIARTTPPKATEAGRCLLKHYLRVKQLEQDVSLEMDMEGGKGFSTLGLGVNADSLDTWFPDVIRPFLFTRNIVLDLVVDDQDRTHLFLKDGRVSACIGTRDTPLQGCRMEYLGSMDYHPAATKAFAQKWFPGGLTVNSVKNAPAIIYNRNDDLHFKMLKRILGRIPSNMPIHYIPSSHQFPYFMALGTGYGMIPVLQSRPYIQRGELIDIAPDFHESVHLYLHCWNIESDLLNQLTKRLKAGAKTYLK